MKLFKDESGLSVVVGTLLLVLIVVASVSALALMVNAAQKKEMDQRSLRAAVESENLKILSLVLNDPDGDGSWNTIILTVVNLNTEESRIVGLNINERNAENYMDLDGLRDYNFQNQFPVPPARSTKIFLNLTSNFTSPVNISKNEAIRIILFTSLTNQFENVFLPPVPIIKANVESEQIGTEFHDILTLDGSDSFERGGTIVNYTWEVANSTGSLGNLSGQKARMNFNLSNTGRFWINLTEEDSKGMLGFIRWEIP